MHTIFCYMPGINTPQMVGSTGSITNAKKTAVDFALHYGHAFIKHSESVDCTHFRKEGLSSVRITHK